MRRRMSFAITEGTCGTSGAPWGHGAPCADAAAEFLPRRNLFGSEAHGYDINFASCVMERSSAQGWRAVSPPSDQKHAVIVAKHAFVKPIVEQLCS